MRVLTVGTMFPPQHLGGYELAWQGVVRHLRAAGHEVRILCADTVVAPGAAETDADVHRTLRWFWRDHAWPRLGWRERGRIARHDVRVLRAHEATFRPDVVAFFAMGGLPLLLTRVPSAPTAAFVHDDWLDYGPRADPPARLLPPRADAWAFVSEHTRRGRPGTVLPSGVAAAFRDPQPPRPWRGSLLHVGRLDARKGVRTAVAALDHLPGATLTLAGEGPERRPHPRARYAGNLGRPALRAAYADADAVLFPVEWDEPWGLVPLEAMGMGRPVVATGRGGSAEYLRDGENALLVPPGDPRAVAAAVNRLRDDAALRARLREGGIATAATWAEERFHAGAEALLGRLAADAHRGQRR
jgi:glycogen synthase